MGSNQLVELEKLDWSKRFTIECGRDALRIQFQRTLVRQVSAIAFVIK